MIRNFRIRCENIEEFNLIQRLLNSEGYLWNSLHKYIHYDNSFPVIILDDTKNNSNKYRLAYNSVDIKNFNIRAISLIRKKKINNIFNEYPTN